MNEREKKLMHNDRIINADRDSVTPINDLYYQRQHDRKRSRAFFQLSGDSPITGGIIEILPIMTIN